MPARLDQVLKLLDKTPGDSFLLYAAAVEMRNAGELERCLTYLSKTLEIDPDYLYAYYQQGQVLEQQGQPDAARVAYAEGFRRARAAGDTKAASELQGALDILG